MTGETSVRRAHPRSLPHILLITCHDLGRHLGCYGVETVHSPHLDALAQSGVRFSHAFTTSPGCSPARAALATGRYPHANGVMGLTHPPFGWDLAPGEMHMAQILASAGYSTHLFGFQHVSPHVERLGFQHTHGFDEVLGCHDKPGWARNVAGRVAHFLEHIETDNPLYVEINLEEPHRPYDQDGAGPDESKGVFVPGYLPAGPAARAEMAELQGAIRQADAGIGKILGALDSSDLRESTIVIFMADHGLAMPRAKCTLYDPGLEISLLMRWPAAGFAGGRVFPEMVSNIDVLPTILEALDLPVPTTVQGHSFLPLLRGEQYIPRSVVFGEKTYHSYLDPMRAVRTDRFKYIRNFEATFAVEVPGDVQAGRIYREHVGLYVSGEHPPVELYDLDADPLEHRNLAGDPDLVGVERWLDTRLWSWMEETGDPLLYGPIVSPAYRESLAQARPKRLRDGEDEPSQSDEGDELSRA
ncbi:MAG TPA: sulfatase [Chloroflexota bacterium]